MDKALRICVDPTWGSKYRSPRLQILVSKVVAPAHGCNIRTLKALAAKGNRRAEEMVSVCEGFPINEVSGEPVCISLEWVPIFNPD